MITSDLSINRYIYVHVLYIVCIVFVVMCSMDEKCKNLILLENFDTCTCISTCVLTFKCIPERSYFNGNRFNIKGILIRGIDIVEQSLLQSYH